MSPAASGVRSALLVQAAVTLLFGLLRPGASSAWTVATVAVAVAAVGLAAAMQARAALRTAVLGFEGVAVAFGALGLVAGHYVPGTIIGISLLVKVAQTSVEEFVGTPVVASFGEPGLPPAPPAVGAPAPWAVPAPPTAGAPAPWAVPAPPAVAPWASAPFLPPAPGDHPGGSTVVPPPPVVPAQAAAPAELPVVPGPEWETPRPAPSPLEQAARELAAAPAPEAPPAPPEPELPRSAPACMTILPA